MFAKMLGKSFLFSKGDEDWRAKRRATAHAFYKERLEIMMNTLSDTILHVFASWSALIEA
jgi:cytochrome P450